MTEMAPCTGCEKNVGFGGVGVGESMSTISNWRITSWHRSD
jgi:hypothetical protein